MLTLISLALIAAGLVLVRWTWFGVLVAALGALLMPLPAWLITAVHSAAH